MSYSAQAHRGPSLAVLDIYYLTRGDPCFFLSDMADRAGHASQPSSVVGQIVTSPISRCWGHEVQHAHPGGMFSHGMFTGIDLVFAFALTVLGASRHMHATGF